MMEINFLLIVVLGIGVLRQGPCLDRNVFGLCRMGYRSAQVTVWIMLLLPFGSIPPFRSFRDRDGG